ncbi:nucleotidyltransferase family protein [Sediminibacterium soli]|uniref:nucleotidyltransferase family protein n=1 Tax=Sediminibacterium soli TaxID=2698829 RepID=UPI00137B12DE|nr:nucleotidyltransferase family protein [Sediminibacterium soli]NCI46211.1 NTP transferase domain-containing protein [Sediminibacterium soli]
MRVTEAIILAGGLGTRLRSAVPDLPKCMAPVQGRPFIAFVIDHLRQQGISQFIFSLGYRSEAFTDFLAGYLPENSYRLVIETEPLGTGGAIRYACGFAKEEQVMALNGDSIFKISIQEQIDFHLDRNADCTLALKPMRHFDRYGSVLLNPDNRIASFEEKRFIESGFINGGVYVLNRSSFLAESLPEKFSFETDYLQALHGQRNMYGLPQDAYFIDIGIPEDYERAQLEL